jgi:hypothetical protein
MKRRRRFFRDDVLAPWLTLLVILGFWWGGARMMGPSAQIVVSDADDDDEAAADAPETHAVLASPRHTVPAPARASVTRDVVETLEDRHLIVPVQGIEASSIVSNFDDDRGTGRKHEALDSSIRRKSSATTTRTSTVMRLALQRARSSRRVKRSASSAPPATRPRTRHIFTLRSPNSAKRRSGGTERR